MQKILTGQVELPYQMIEIFCDTCGHPMTAEIQNRESLEMDIDDIKTILSIFPCEICRRRIKGEEVTK